MNIYYDGEGDLLELRMGKPRPSYYEYIGNDTFERRDKKTKKVFGYAIHNLKKQKKNQMHDIDIQALIHS